MAQSMEKTQIKINISLEFVTSIILRPIVEEFKELNQMRQRIKTHVMILKHSVAKNNFLTTFATIFYYGGIGSNIVKLRSRSRSNPGSFLVHSRSILSQTNLFQFKI